MAMLTDNNHSISNPNPTRRASPDSVSKRSNTQASAYAVDAGTMALTGFHFSTTSGAGGMCSISTPRPRAFHTTNTHLSQDWGGAFEALSGVPSPPPSPDAAAAPSPRLGFKAGRSSSGKGDVGGAAAHHITGECERLFCETLKAVFLVERDTGLENSLVVDARKKKKTKNKHIDDDEGARTPFQEHDLSSPTSSRHDSLPTPSPSPHEGWLYPAPPPPPSTTRAVHVAEYVEAWDYAGGARFRGFVAGRDGEEHHRAMFIFFDKEVIGKDLKPGLMALLELASSDAFACARLIVCVDRDVADDDEAEAARDTSRALGWVGFELMMLDAWAPRGEKGCVSDRWIFMGMDL